ncbi:unnamed protein product [Lactuca virosa]|uniref:3-deoxy-8-phosphooctulonate synthase n=1 Tax=Lactuca virosa TaxID=75947 RepID=A0AAU9NWC6_9ASTR|nr:unnamed protein product [Lactuca virosa]
MAIIMALLSGFVGVYTGYNKETSFEEHKYFDVVVNKGFFHGYSLITVLMIINHALSGIAVSMVMKYADNIVKQPAGKNLEGGGVGSGGLQELIPCVARTAVAVGVDGLFMEVHNDPLNAPVDGPTQWPLRHLERLLEELVAIAASFNCIRQQKGWMIQFLVKKEDVGGRSEWRWWG